jgi:hypothetical protein
MLGSMDTRPRQEAIEASKDIRNGLSSKAPTLADTDTKGSVLWKPIEQEKSKTPTKITGRRKDT